MKTLIALVFSLAACLPMASAQDPFAEPELKPVIEKKEFRVSAMGKSKEQRELFQKLWAAMQIHPAEMDGSTVTMIIKQAVGVREGKQIYVAEMNGERVAVILRDKMLHEGDVVTATIKEDGVYDTQTVLGAAKRFRFFRETEPKPNPNAPSREDFMKRIKAGEEFTTGITVPGACGQCFGDGKLGALQGNRTCNSCGGSGEAKQIWTIKW